MVIELLAVWGPGVDAPRVSVAEAETHARTLATSHYENFPVVTWALPKALHQHFYNVYAFCRWADDLGDEVGDRARSLELLGWWRHELAECYAGRPRHPVFVALAPTIARFRIPQQPFADLISAFEQDQTVTDYESFEQLQDYCRRSADPVGRIVLYLCERFTPQNADWSDSICTGLQLANFWQDVARDYDIGRVYLPREDRRRFDYSDVNLAARTTNPEFLELMEFEVARARQLLLAGRPLISAMPGRLQLDIDLFISGGLAILGEIERIGFRVWERRPVVTKARLGRLFVGAAGRGLLRSTGLWRAGS
ncbi:MAG: squalene synthase HpnC [Planctomycetaceae bacterium]|nr:squalene synthase HpnC [Planctomycetaceae bacterium]